MFNMLIKRCWKPDDTYTFCPDLADKWESADGITYVFHLHPGVKWHDGVAFTANDVAFSINESRKWTPGRFKSTAWDGIKGSAEATAAFTKDGTLPNVPGVKVVDDNTIQLTLTASLGNWLNDVAEPDAAIMPQHVLKDLLKGVARDKVQSTIETSAFATTAPIGTGPYKFIKYETDQYTQFEANPDYFRGAPKIKNIFVKRGSDDFAIAAGEAGDLDLSVRINPAEKGRLEKSPLLDVLSSTGVGTYGPHFNLKSSACDVACRRAVGYAIDAQGIVDKIYGGAGHINKGVNPGMPAADDQEFFVYDPAKAKQILSTSKWDISKPLRIIFDNSFAGVTLWAPVMQQNLEAVGFKVELTGYESTAAIENYNKLDTYDFYLMQGGSQGAGPFFQLPEYNCKLTTPAVYSGFLLDCNIDALFVKAGLEPDPAKQNEIFKQISGIINKQVDKISLFTTNALSFKSKKLVGPFIPKQTREYITTTEVQTWYFTP
jgi:peptide/nickel transport system substrate-binding protein